MKNEVRRKISVTLPDSLVDEIDNLASSFNRSRSELITLLLSRYVRETKKTEIKEQLKKGYLEMGNLNLCIAEESLLSDKRAYEIYEEFLGKGCK